MRNFYIVAKDDKKEIKAFKVKGTAVCREDGFEFFCHKRSDGFMVSSVEYGMSALPFALTRKKDAISFFMEEYKDKVISAIKRQEKELECYREMIKAAYENEKV